MPHLLRYVIPGIAALILTLLAPPVRGQQIDLSGLAFVDYFYTLSSPVEDDEDLHGFTYRRLFLTTDFTLSDEFFGRARIEGNEETLSGPGTLVFVKDLWLAWKYHDEHEARIGIMPPPVYELSEAVWGYRSLEKTILDLQGINNSRDFGVRFHGPLGGDFRYAVMLGNGNGVRPEADPQKKAYAQVSLEPPTGFAFSVGVDRAGRPDPRDASTRVSGFAGYRSDLYGVGVEVFWYQEKFDVGDDFHSTGASLFGRYRIASAWEIVGRLDLVSEESGDMDADEMFAVVGASYTPVRGVRLIPNLWVFDDSRLGDSEVLARMTFEIAF